MAQEETVLWEGKPSQIVNLFTFWLIVPVLRVMTTKYRVTNQRIVKNYGILSKQTDNLELYRVRDIQVRQPLFLRLFSKANVSLESSDMTHPTMVLNAVPNIPELTEGLRQTIEDVRRATGVRIEESR